MSRHVDKTKEAAYKAVLAKNTPSANFMQKYPKYNTMTAADKRKLDNQVNKINKRIMAAAKAGGFASQAFTALATQILDFDTRVKTEQQIARNGKVSAAGTGNEPTPISYTMVDGIKVPQIRRASWVLAVLQQSEIDDMLQVVTAQAETAAVEKYLTESGKDVTKQAVRETMEDREASNDFLKEVWEWLYKFKGKHQEIANFLENALGQLGSRAVELHNSKAIQLYNKYAPKEQVAHDRPLTASEQNYLRARAAEAEVELFKAKTPEQQKRAIADYLTYKSARGSYSDDKYEYDYPNEDKINSYLDKFNRGEW